MSEMSETNKVNDFINQLIEDENVYDSLENPPTTRNFTKFLDDEVNKNKTYTNHWYNENPKLTQFCCFINLYYKSQEDNIYTFEGSVTYEYDYHLNPLTFTLVWDSQNNTYYLHDDCHNKKCVDKIDDRYWDMTISGKQIVTQFFNNPPKFINPASS